MKDAYEPKEPKSPEWETLSERLLKLSDDNIGYEVLIVLPDALTAKVIDPIAEHAAAVVAQREWGQTHLRSIGAVVSITPVAAPEPSPKAGIFLRKSKFGRSVATMMRDASGVVHVRNPRRANLFVLDSHRVNSIFNSFNTARTQIPAGAHES